jgi:hypothetical protein
MTTLIPVNNTIYVEKNDKLAKRKLGDSPFMTALPSTNEGVVKFSSSEEYPVGLSVRFGNDFAPENVDGIDLLVMNVSNIRAKVVDSSNDNQG